MTLTPPATVYAGTVGTFTVDYTNTGNIDMAAPLLDVSAVGALIIFSASPAFASEFKFSADTFKSGKFGGTTCNTATGADGNGWAANVDQGLAI